jgi:hypothetical protein
VTKLGVGELKNGSGRNFEQEIAGMFLCNSLEFKSILSSPAGSLRAWNLLSPIYTA